MPSPKSPVSVRVRSTIIFLALPWRSGSPTGCPLQSDLSNLSGWRRKILYRVLYRDFRGFSGRFFSASRSEEHTSELQSLMRISYAVFCLKKKKHQSLINDIYDTH